MLFFLWGEENWRTRRKTLGARREPTTNSSPGQTGGRRGLSPLRHPRSPRTASDIEYRVRKTSGLVIEYTARFVRSCRIHCPCKRHIFPSISFSIALWYWRKVVIAEELHSSLIWMFSLNPTSAVFHSRLHYCRRSKVHANVTLVFVLPLHIRPYNKPSFVRHIAFRNYRAGAGT